jgi:2-oxoglutarate ferredoxin oxidoreductase subunit alpha
MDIAIKIGAAAGEGAFVMGATAGRLFARGGYHVFGYPEYPSLIRGGHNSYQIIVSDRRLDAPLMESDVVIAVNKDAIKFHADSIKKGGLLLFDSELDISGMSIRADVKKVGVPVASIISEQKADSKMKNTAYLGALLATVGYPLEYLAKALEDQFARKGKEVVDMNTGVAKAGYDFVKSQFKPSASIKPIGKPRPYMTGNDALAIGFVKGGLTFYSSYPMTPATGVLHYLIKNQEKAGIVVLQAEDEIAAANMAVGAAFAGARAATGTSGGGFALKTETVSMAAMAETPVVFFVSQRPGPSTGLPTWTEQADLFQVLGAGQGEFPRIILAPADAKEMVQIGADSLNMAEEFQVPVFVLSDKYLSENYYTIDGLDMAHFKVNRGKLADRGLPELKPGQKFKRYEITQDGISPRSVPGVPNGQHVASSYEHQEDGYSTESFDMRTAQVDKRLRKLEKILERSYEPKIHSFKGEDALVVWGSQLGPALRAAEEAKMDVIHFSWIYPLSKEKIVKAFSNYKAVYFAENNRTGVFEKLMLQETGMRPAASIRKYNGRPLLPHQLAKAMESVRKTGKDVLIKNEEYDNFEFYSPWRY